MEISNGCLPLKLSIQRPVITEVAMNFLPVDVHKQAVVVAAAVGDNGVDDFEEKLSPELVLLL